MDDATRLLERLLAGDALLRAVFSNRRKKAEPCTKIILRPVLIAGEKRYQAELHHRDKVFHENLKKEDVSARVQEWMRDSFRQAVFFASDGDYTLLANKPDNIRIKKSEPTGQAASLSHDREKQHILPEGTPCDVLIRLGIMTDSGKVVAKHRDKFQQINRFLEIVRDCLPSLPDKPLIVDFGCGKSYLTFALYHYLNEQLGIGARFAGYDLKEDVISFCNDTAAALGYENLVFYVGDIAHCKGVERADMVVTLHACDTATDEALIRAVRWDAAVILSVPCCQHELFPQLEQPDQSAILKHGLLKERFASILTDALRALALEYYGYRISMVEFVDLEHTAKNLMLRCTKGKTGLPKADRMHIKEQFASLCAYWNAQPSIARLFDES